MLAVLLKNEIVLFLYRGLSRFCSLRLENSMKKHIEQLKKLGPCSKALEFAAKFSTLQEAWDACERGDWMLWLIGKHCGEPNSKSRKKLVLTACKCARLAWKWMSKEGRHAINIAEKHAHDKATLQEVEDAAAHTAYAAAHTAYAAYAAYAAAYAADAAAYTANAVGVPRNKTLKSCAKIVRKAYPKPPRKRRQ